ncbi:hypothetical protein [Pseudoxanthomonas sp.]|uniref:hypothetical protein n=1 Tax=Pseudoxanthomonas sp. TaxID=1871049 RepID=UPI0026300259|nr:hypothetical protein [Pseudoxanthomonas sp.]WDS35069.1 MAG: hypothetical protein O8I58_11875 [Pseudoxanthomonas sp.]
MKVGYALFIGMLAIGVGLQSASAQVVLTPAQMQAKLEAMKKDAQVQISRSVIGKAAVNELNQALGAGAFSLSRFGFDSSPLAPNSKDVQAAFVHSDVMTRQEAFAAGIPDAKPSLAVGDTVTHTWTDSGWSYSATERWDGSAWQLISFTATKMGSTQ